MRSIYLLFALSLVIAAAPAFSATDYWPTAGWRVSTPEEQGVDSGALAGMMADLVEKPFNIHSLTVTRHGYVMLDACFAPYTAGTPHDVASVTKSVTSTLIGIAIDKGFIKSVDEPVLSFFPDRTIANLDERKKAMKLSHLLTMTSGLTCNLNGGEVTLMEMMASKDWVQFVLDLPMQYAPGEKFVYSSAGVHLLSAILHKATGMTALDFANEHLFGPLGIEDAGWPMDPGGTDNHGWGDLRLKPHDMAKLGLLFLQNGQGEGKQVMSAEWVAAATARQVTSTNDQSHPGYGYLWWAQNEIGFAALGRGGQRIVVVPEKDLVMVVTAGVEGPAGRRIEDLAPMHVVPAVKSDTPLPANAAAVEQLNGYVKRAAVREEKPVRVEKAPKTAKRVGGKLYKLQPNPLGLTSFSMDFPAKVEAFARLKLADGADFSFTVGLDGVFRFSKGREGLSAAAKGFWKDDKTFTIELDEIANINRWNMLVTFDGDKVTLMMRSLSGLGAHKIAGESTGKERK